MINNLSLFDRTIFDKLLNTELNAGGMDEMYRTRDGRIVFTYIYPPPGHKKYRKWPKRINNFTKRLAKFYHPSIEAEFFISTGPLRHIEIIIKLRTEIPKLQHLLLFKLLENGYRPRGEAEKMIFDNLPKSAVDVL